MDGLPILYSFRRCPYAMRARMAIWLSGVPVQLREVELKAKPSALIVASAKGTVPVLQLPNGRVIDESREIMVWALSHSEAKVWLGSTAQQATTAALIDLNDGPFKGHLDRYKYPTRFPGQAVAAARSEGEALLQTLEQALDRQAFLVASERSMADIAIFPFVRQFALVDPAWFMASPYPKLRDWLNLWISSELFAGAMQKYPPWSAGQPGVIFGKAV